MNPYPAKYLYQLLYLTPLLGEKRSEVEECILAENLNQAMVYWQRELSDPDLEILMIRRSVPVVATCPADIATRYGYETKKPSA